jgi:ATP-dependent Lon protease
MYGALLVELNLAGFDAQLSDAVLDKLAPVAPRDLRKTLLDSLGYAVADGRGHVSPGDVRFRQVPGKGRIGF